MTAHAEDAAERHRLKIDGLAVVTEPATIESGPDKGLILQDGQIANISELEPGAIRISGTLCGWIDSDNAVSVAEAAKIWDAKLSSTTKSPRVYASAACIQSVNGNATKAVKYAHFALRLKSVDIKSQAAATAVLGQYNKAGKFANIVEQFIDSTNMLTDYEIGMLLNMLAVHRRWGLVRRMLSKINVSDDSSNEILRLAALAELNSRKYRDAQELCEVALRRDPSDISAQIAKAVTLFLSGKQRNAVEWLDECISKNGSASRLHRLRGEYLCDEGEFDEGLKALHIAADLSPEDSKPNFSLGSYLLQQARNSGYVSKQAGRRAAKYLREACVLDKSNNMDYVRNYGYALVYVGESKEADRYILSRLQASGQSAEDIVSLIHVRQQVADLDNYLAKEAEKE